MAKIKQTLEQGPRKFTPTDIEIEAAKHAMPVTIRVYLLDRTYYKPRTMEHLLPTPWQVQEFLSYVTVPVEAWTTVAELNAAVAQRLNVRRREGEKTKSHPAACG